MLGRRRRTWRLSASPRAQSFRDDAILNHLEDPSTDTRRQAIFGSLVGYDQALGLTLRVDDAWQGIYQAPRKVLDPAQLRAAAGSESLGDIPSPRSSAL